jgi:S1-C subfamily serine protease
VTAVDWVIVAFCVLLAIYGYLQGFIVGVLSLVGFALGAFIGTRLGPLLLPDGSHSQYAPLFGLLGALLAGGVLASGFEGVGLHARARLRLPGLRTIDGLLGAALTACVGLGIAWIVGAVALDSTTSASLKTKLERSQILRGLDELLPPSGPILHALARFDPLPAIHGPVPNVPKPTPAILHRPAVHTAAPSVVRIVGTACGLGVEGSGWVAAPGIVVTNAHVVAGEDDTRVEVSGQAPGLPAQAIDFDPHDDIAILRVPGLTARPLALAGGSPSGTSAAILGYPEDGPFDAEPGRIGQTVNIDTEDAYGNGPVLRSVTEFLGRVRPGNSGGPLVDSSGHVVATVFAALTGAPGSGAGFAVPDSLVRQRLKAAQARGGAVSTGPCAG